MKLSLKRIISIGFIALLAFSPFAQASDTGMYEVSVTNLTRGEVFTPILVATHKKASPLFTLGTPASDELIAVAESGNITPFSDALVDSGLAYATATNGALLGPGETATIQVAMHGQFRYVSLVSMMVPTNDGFIAINGVKGPKRHKTIRLVSPAYDAGSETNDELCANIPGPYCGGEALSPNDAGEGYVHVHGAIHGIGDLAPADFDWRNPVAKISIKRLK